MFKDSSLGFSGSPKCYRLTIPVVPGLVRLSVGLPVTDPIATLYQESCIPNPPPFFLFLCSCFFPFSSEEHVVRCEALRSSSPLRNLEHLASGNATTCPGSTVRSTRFTSDACYFAARLEVSVSEPPCEAVQLKNRHR